MTKQLDVDSSVDRKQPDSPDQSAKRIGWLKAILIGVGSAGALAIALVFWTALVGGKAYGERAATDLVMPAGSFWLLLFAATVASYWRGNRVVAAGLAIVSLAFWVTFNGRVAGVFKESMSYPVESDPATSLLAPLDAVVLLGGYAGNNRFGVAELSGDGQRLMLAAQLWHAGKTKTVISTGTGHLGMGDPSELGRELLVSIGVPDDVIFEVPGENTASEMRALRGFLQSPPKAWLETVSHPSDKADAHIKLPPRPTVGLVTSAMHMPRAVRLAKREELQFKVIPCCLSRPVANGSNPRDLIPSAAAGKTFAVALKEWLAAIVGR